MVKRVSVLGAGAWGTTLAVLLRGKGYPVSVWEVDETRARQLKKTGTLRHFPCITLPSDIIVTSDIELAAAGADYVILAVPSHTLRETAKRLRKFRGSLGKTIIVSATKGIENDSLKRMSEVIAEELPFLGGRIAVLSGPTIAKEVANKLPTAATIASKSGKTAKACQKLFMTPYFRIYTHSDVAGVEAGGSLKNVFALAAGIADGLGMGYNTKAALVARGLREMVKLGVKLGGKPSTLFGLSGLGDLIVTSFSPDSRNRTLGEKIGRGKSLRQAEREIIMVAEGVKTALSANELGISHKLELPIIRQVYEIICNHKPAGRSLKDLMLRNAKPEDA